MSDDFATGKAVVSIEVEDVDGEIKTKTIGITPDDLDWEIKGSDERQMGAELAHAAIHYFNEGHVEWTVWEYPIGCYE